MIPGARPYVLALVTTVLATACTPPPAPPEESDAVTKADAVPLPACPTAAELFGIDGSDDLVGMPDGTDLPVILGFQGFLFVRVGLRAGMPLPPTVKLRVRITVPGLVDVMAPFATVKTKTADATWQTGDVPFFFNDVTLADLVGRDAHVGVWTDLTACRLAGAADLRLVSGGTMGADAAMWAEVDAGGK